MSILRDDGTTIGKPENVSKYDENEYVFALCRCPTPITMGIPIKRIKGVSTYKYCCSECGTSGNLICGFGLK